MTHTDDLRNVNEGDTVHIKTTEGKVFGAECTDVCVERATEASGEVRVTTMWRFDSPLGRLDATIMDGLRSSPDDPEFPKYTELWSLDKEETFGYIETVAIGGKV